MNPKVSLFVQLCYFSFSFFIFPRENRESEKKKLTLCDSSILYLRLAEVYLKKILYSYKYLINSFNTKIKEVFFLCLIRMCK